MIDTDGLRKIGGLTRFFVESGDTSSVMAKGAALRSPRGLNKVIFFGVFSL
jgi:hypothetical protein